MLKNHLHTCRFIPINQANANSTASTSFLPLLIHPQENQCMHWLCCLCANVRLDLLRAAKHVRLVPYTAMNE